VKRIGVVVVAAAAVAGVLAQVAPAASTAPTASKAAVTVNVTAVDFRFRLSKTSVPKGSVVTFKITNKGNAPHDYDMPTLKKGTAYLAPGKSASFKVTMSKAGSFRFVCTVPRHAELGMTGNFKVK
jgi:uncharacterized cupredoxin-like copper-binding protein